MLHDKCHVNVQCRFAETDRLPDGRRDAQADRQATETDTTHRSCCLPYDWQQQQLQEELPPAGFAMRQPCPRRPAEPCKLHVTPPASIENTAFNGAYISAVLIMNEQLVSAADCIRDRRVRIGSACESQPIYYMGKFGTQLTLTQREFGKVCCKSSRMSKHCLVQGQKHITGTFRSCSCASRANLSARN